MSQFYPTFFTTMTIDGLGAERLRDQCLDWIVGRERYSSLRQRRSDYGIPADLEFPIDQRLATWALGSTRIDVVSEPNRTLIQFEHADTRYQGVRWRTLVELRPRSPSANEYEEVVELLCGVGRRLPPRYRNLPPTTGAPYFVTALLEEHGLCLRGQASLAREVQPLADLSLVEAFVDQFLLDPDRRLPVVLISRDETGRFLVSPRQLHERLRGQCVIVAIGDSTVTRVMERRFEERGYDPRLGRCFNGAVRIYYPGIDPEDTQIHYLWHPERVRTLADDPEERAEVLANRIAEWASWRMMPADFFSRVEDIRNREELERAWRDQNEQGARELFEKMHSELEAFRQEVSELRDEAHTWERTAEELEEENRELKEENRRLRSKLDALAGSWRSGSEVSIGRIRPLGDYLDSKKIETLQKALELLQLLYPDRVVVLNSAWDSAREADKHRFEKVDKAWELLHKLATDYWSCMQRGDVAGAKNVFPPNTFADQESKEVHNDPEARRARTFTWIGREIYMPRHLKIGVKDSPSRTWRCHFEYDNETGKVVIGHCGGHLPLPNR